MTARPGIARAGSFRQAPRRSAFAARRGPYGGQFYHHNRFFQPWFQPSLWSNWGYPGYYFGPGYPWSSLSYPGFPEDQSSSIWGSPGEAEAAGAPEYQPGYDDTLANQVQELSDEVAGMQQGQARPAGAPAQAAPREQSIPTVFAYRDGHQLEAQNYAIQGQTLWVFQDQITRKISLADLDLSATKRLNDARGVEFTVPQ